MPVFRFCCTIFFTAALVLLPQLAIAQSSQDKAIIVFDGSGSMWGQIAGKTKIEIARETLSRVVDTLPKDLNLGLVAYGHNRKGDCSDIETLVNVGPVSKTGTSIAQSVGKISPKGKTPLSAAVKQAAEMLRFTEDKATVILVTDGIETCNADPCALGSQLERSGIDFTAHVVGFGLSQDDGKKVSCLAENTGGLYLQADNADELADALGKTVAVLPPADEPETREKPEFNLLGKLALVEGAPPLPIEATKGRVKWFLQPLDEQGNPGNKKLIDRENEAEWYSQAGDYLLSVEYFGAGRFEQKITLSEFDVTDETYALNAARVSGVGTFMESSYDIDWAGMEWRLTEVDKKQKFTVYGYNLDVVVPPGRYEISLGIRGEKESVNKPRLVELQAGDTKQQDFILPHSKITLDVAEANGSPNNNIRQRFAIRNEDGSPGEIIKYEASSKPVFLRPGKYVATVELWDGTKRNPVELPIDVGLAEIQNFQVSLP